VRRQPAGELRAIENAGCHRQHRAFLIVHEGVDFKAVQHEEDFHRGVADTLVAIQEGVVGDKGEA
jgi:hypothetical protein